MKQATAYEVLNQLWEGAVSMAREKRDLQYAERHNGKRSKFWASNIGGCLRASLFAYRGFKQTHPPGAGRLARMEIGNHIEAWTLGILSEFLAREGKGRLETQVRVENKFHMARTDALLYCDSDVIWDESVFPAGPPTPIEIKSLHPAALDNRERQMHGWLPYEHHCLQLAQFIALSRELDVPCADEGCLLYVSLDGRRRINAVSLPEWETELRERWSMLEECAERNTLPDRLERGRYPCTISKSPCGYFGHCWE